MKTFFAIFGYVLLMTFISYEVFGPVDIQVNSAAPVQVELVGESLHKLPTFEDSEILCLAENIFHEARNQSVEGMTAVAAVTFNRLKSVNYPNTICDVVHDPHQFSWVYAGVTVDLNNTIDIDSWELSKKIAMEVLNKGVPYDMLGVYHYHADYVQPEWAMVKIEHKRIDNHIFYKSTI